MTVEKTVIEKFTTFLQTLTEEEVVALAILLQEQTQAVANAFGYHIVKVRITEDMPCP
jgi:hypothetical protein